MTETILRLLTRLSEAGDDAILPGGLAASFQGPVFDRLLARRIIVEQAALSEWDLCDRCDCGLASRPIHPVGGDRFRADCPLDRRQDVELTWDDLRVFRIGSAALVSAIASAAGFDATPALVASSVWQLGATPSGRAVFLVLEPAALARDGIATTLRQAAQVPDITILVPELPAEAMRQLHDSGFHLVAILTVMTPATTGLGVAIDVAALHPVSLTPSLRVRTAMAEVQWHNHSVILSHQMFPVFQRLLEKALSRNPIASVPHVEGTTGRDAKDLIRELRDAFKAAGFTGGETKTLIKSVRSRGYRLGVPASEIVIED